MGRVIDIDAGWGRVCLRLPEGRRVTAASLAARLGLAPPGVPWSQVFKHEVTLAAPALLTEAMPAAGEEQIDAAVVAHMLAVIDAFGRDRIADGQVESDDDLDALLDALRAERDRAAALLDPAAVVELAAADHRTRRSIARERRLLWAVTPVTTLRYRAVSFGKQAVGFPATRALARATGVSGDRLAAMNELLAGVWLGLQHHDDVIDWEDDWSKGGAWSACLARGRATHIEASPGADLGGVRREVLKSGVLETMLDLAAKSFGTAARRADELGCGRLAEWAAMRAGVTHELFIGEREAPGSTLRAHRLQFWAAEVIR
jgi:hypothetical protein